jgi:hypothetical protein
VNSRNFTEHLSDFYLYLLGRLGLKMRINGATGVEGVIWKGHADIDSGVRASFKNLYTFANPDNEKV